MDIKTHKGVGFIYVKNQIETLKKGTISVMSEVDKGTTYNNILK
jgi:chemotaxis protein histidine kinase CheA